MISIIIPTCNIDNLKLCYDSIVLNTNLDDVEQQIGYTKAINIGIKHSVGDFIILLNDDVLLLNQPKNQWIEILHKPFIEDPLVGITGPVKFTWDCG
jgi:glycosyltransferase involved in cell wall biosynthesis